MPASKFLAFDFGAASGRAILGVLDNNKIMLEEIHRFPNRQVEESGHIHWDMPYLFNELRKGLFSAVKHGHNDLCGIGVDTWGVDFGLIGKDNRLLSNPFAYRDSRTDGMMEKAFKLMPKEEIYRYTGIQFMQLNSIFQLYSMIETGSPLLKESESLLFMPDILNFYMTGKKYSEYTIASTSQLLNAEKKSWERAIFDKLNMPFEMMAPLIESGTVIGSLVPELLRDTGLSPVDIIASGCHDTASAVAAVPAESSGWAYLSSGTWSLVGVEIDSPIINENSLKFNFTNEGGVNNSIRFLRNTMGLWLLQKCLDIWKEQGDSPSYNEVIEMASHAPSFRSIIDPDKGMFLNPPDMPAAISEFCRQTGQPVPEKKGEILRCIFESLALKYRFIIEKIDMMRAEPVKKLHIVGGGSQNSLLNQLSANATGLPVIAGPVEATALGNILVQAIAKKELSGIEEGRTLIKNSFPLINYEPEDREKWQEIYKEKKDMFI